MRTSLSEREKALIALRLVDDLPIDRIARKRTYVDGKPAAKVVPGGCPRPSEPSKIEPETLRNRLWGFLERSEACLARRDALGCAGDAPKTLLRRSEAAPGEQRAPQKRPGTLRERAGDALETL